METSRVEQLAYAGGQDESGGGYWEALVIRDANGEHYVLHEYLIRVWKEGGKNKKVECSSIDDLLKKFNTWGSIGKELQWEKTNKTCGYDIPVKEFEEAFSRRFEKECATSK